MRIAPSRLPYVMFSRGLVFGGVLSTQLEKAQQEHGVTMANIEVAQSRLLQLQDVLRKTRSKQQAAVVLSRTTKLEQLKVRDHPHVLPSLARLDLQLHLKLSRRNLAHLLVPRLALGRRRWTP